MSKGKSSKFLKFILFLLFVATALGINYYFNLAQYLDVDTIRSVIESYGIWAPVVFMILYAASILLFLPASPFSVVSGVVFGGVFGTIYVVVGATAGAALAFLLSRFLGEDFIHRLLSEKFRQVEKYNQKLSERGLLSVLIVRLIPAFPFTASSFAFGLTRVKFRDFFLATLFGIIPGSYAYVNLGSGLVTMNFTQLAIAVGLIIILSLSAYIYEKVTRELKEDEYDLIVIGSGAAGLNIAGFAAKVGLKVLLIEKEEERIGGDCLNFGCVPSKALISVARKIKEGQRAQQFGVKQKGEVDFSEVKEYIEERQGKIRKHENKEYLEEKGMDVEIGKAEFSGKNSVTVADREYTADKIVLATGASPREVDLPGSEDVELHNTETIWDIEELPEKMVVIGAGFVGLELAQAFQYLGSEVHVFERGEKILSQAPEAVSKKMEQNLKQAGVKIHKNAAADSFEGQTLIVEQDGQKQEYDFDLAFASIGRVVNTKNIGLDEARVETKDNGQLKLTDNLQTTNSNIYACGDVVGGYQFTHVTELHASVVIKNMLSPASTDLNTDHIAWVMYTDPEVAAFGLQKQELEDKNIDYTTLTDDFSEDDRAIVSNYSEQSQVELY
ncbi:MAG: FAD-dependent oxidoreductase, partial [Candidatus Magasanikbacteria bacterium]